jgi:hypothetical protein
MTDNNQDLRIVHGWLVEEDGSLRRDSVWRNIPYTVIVQGEGLEEFVLELNKAIMSSDGGALMAVSRRDMLQILTENSCLADRVRGLEQEVGRNYLAPCLRQNQKHDSG